MKTAKLESDYSPGTFMRVSQTDDCDVVISITGKKDGEFRIATSGTHYYGKNSVRFFHLCSELIDVMNGMEEGENQLALAKVGIAALVDEATGYQNVRKKDALHSYLKKQKEVTP